MSYSDKLKLAKWQKKRLEILERDSWKCTSCGEDWEQLHVHHLTYSPGKEPWEYDNEKMITLCHKCHAIEHQLQIIKNAGFFCSIEEFNNKIYEEV